MLEWITDPNAWMALFTLTFLEIVLGVDNIIFLSLVVAKLPKHQQKLARKLGLFAAMLMRILLLASLVWVAKLSYPLFYISSDEFLTFNANATHLTNAFAVSMRDIILGLGGLFLIWKGISEIKEMFNKDHEEATLTLTKTSFLSAIIQIMMLDIVFSLDSVITAVGLSENIFIMILSVIFAVMMMMFAVKAIGEFVEKYPNFKMLAIAFIVMIGAVLVIESAHIHVNKSYIYMMIFFSLTIEILNFFRNKCIKNKEITDSKTN